MTTARPTPGFTLALGTVSLAALGLRLWPLLRGEGPLAFPIDYDEGVYFSAAALWANGVMPYRDFAFVHPPGLLVFLRAAMAVLAQPEVSSTFVAARVAMPLLGAVSTALVGLLVRQRGNAPAALLAALLYATYPEAAGTERGVFLEGLLNPLCLGGALAWLAAPAAGRRPWQDLLAGALFGLALATKASAAPWAVAAVLALPAEGRRGALLRAMAGGLAVGALVVAPVALAAPGAFVDQVFRFHLTRPPDGDTDRWVRLAKIFSGRHLVAWVTAALTLLSMLWRLLRRDAVPREERVFSAAWVLTLAGFLAAPAYWAQYNGHLAASECVLAGLGLARGWAWLTPRLPQRHLFWVSAVLVLGFSAPSAWRSVQGVAGPAPQQLALKALLAAQLGPGDCVTAFEPGLGVLGDRLPGHGDGAPVVVDSYAVMLRRAAADGRRFESAAAAFAGGAAQPEVRARLSACRLAVFGWRGDWQLHGDERVWFDAHFTALGLDVWAQPSPP